MLTLLQHYYRGILTLLYRRLLVYFGAYDTIVFFLCEQMLK
jgi:hypothetical protein